MLKVFYIQIDLSYWQYHVFIFMFCTIDHYHHFVRPNLLSGKKLLITGFFFLIEIYSSWIFIPTFTWFYFPQDLLLWYFFSRFTPLGFFYIMVYSTCIHSKMQKNYARLRCSFTWRISYIYIPTFKLILVRVNQCLQEITKHLELNYCI